MKLRVANEMCKLKNKVQVAKMKVQVENKSGRGKPNNLKFRKIILCKTLI